MRSPAWRNSPRISHNPTSARLITTLRAGDVITAYVYQAKSGVQVGRTNKVILADGTVLADRDDATPSRYGAEPPK